MRRRYRERNSGGREGGAGGGGGPKKRKKNPEFFFGLSRRKKKMKTERGDSFSACLLFSAIGFNLGAERIPGPAPPLEFTVQQAGLPANKTHVDLPRNGEGLGS